MYYNFGVFFQLFQFDFLRLLYYISLLENKFFNEVFFNFKILAQKVKEIYEDFIKHKKFKTGKLTDLKAKQYRDSDIPEQLAGSLKFAP